MFQSFDETSDSSRSAERVARLRTLFEEAGIDGMIVPRTDEHQSEYIPPASARLAWLTGFTGSAGIALVLKDRASIFVDGRYTVQVRSQVDGTIFDFENMIETPLPDYLAENCAGMRIGFDPWLHTIDEIRRLKKRAEKNGGALVPLEENLIDRIWRDRPASPAGAVRQHEERFAGRSAESKLEELNEILAKDGTAMAILTDPSSVAWTFNIRGSDVEHTPLALAFAVLAREDRPRIFIDEVKLGPEVRAYLDGICEIRPYDGLEDFLEGDAAGKRVALDPALAAEHIRIVLQDAGAEIVETPDPARLKRARKNPVEIAGARAAHLRDGAAVAAFLAWLNAREPGSVTEIEAAERLEAFRASQGEAEQMPLRDISFDTIAGSGPNGAIVHYRVNRRSDRRLGKGELFLLDSGAQYDDGTTDITRTVAIGAPSREMQERFTLVLKGMIAISTARFPKGTRGVDLDPLARIALWKAGADYAHGTGHGVGSYLSVHEGPQSISRRGMTVLEPGMILSNEPGYYREGHFGIRIENLVLTQEPSAIPGGDMPMHAFETLTLAPIDRRLIVTEILVEEEIGWLDAYHARVRESLTPLVDETTRKWLMRATEPLKD